MGSGESRPLGQHLERLWNSGTVSGLSDAELVKRFTSSVGPAAEQAFEALLGRHGPMVLGVCRHILRRPQDVDDAFQATFLVLVRKARSIRIDESLGPWLYGVAYRTAIRARSKVARHRLEGMNDLEEAADPAGGAFAWEIRPMLHEELNRLPEKYRSPIVLCHLEGKSHEEAARMLDWPVGTLSGRLSRGRQLLKDRLLRRGLTASAGMLAARFPGEALQALPSRLAELTIKAALGSGAGPTISTSVLTLTQGVLNAMLIHNLKKAALILVAVAAVTGAIGFRGSWLAAVLGAGEAAASPRQAETRPTTKPVAPASLPTQNRGAPAIETAAKADRSLDPFDAVEMLGVTPKNSPNMADFRDPIPVRRSQSILVIESPDGKGVAAISTEFEHFENNDWKRYEFPTGQTATPIMSNDVLALMMKGETVTEVAAFSAMTGEWKTQRLLNPIKQQIVPVVGLGCALFQEGNNFYAFSAQKGLWDVLSLQGGEKPRASLSGTDIMVQQGNLIFVFPYKLAKWLNGISAKPIRIRQQPGTLPGRTK
jgi:RNA polymerase sigma factor (sigma-70 family)